MKKYGSLIPLPMVDPKVGEDVEGVKIIASNGKPRDNLVSSKLEMLAVTST